MAKPEPITLETGLALTKRLSAADKLKLVTHLLEELEAIVERKGANKRRSSSSTSEGRSLTEEENSLSPGMAAHPHRFGKSGESFGPKH